MPGPFVDGGIVMEFETNSPMEFVQFEPSYLPHDQWLHRRDEFDPGADVSTIINAYVLPESKSYEVRIIEVQAGETFQMGSLAGAEGRSGGADLVQLLSRESIPEEWVRDVTTFDALQD